MAQTTPTLNVASRAGVSYHFDTSATHTVATFATKTDVAYHVRARFVMQEVGSNAKVGSSELIGTFYNSAGTLAQVSTTTSVHAVEGITGTKTPGLGVSGTNIIFTVVSNDTTSVIVRVQADILMIGGDVAPHEFGPSDNA